MHTDLWVALAGVAFTASAIATERVPRIILGLLGFLAIVEGIIELLTE